MGNATVDERFLAFFLLYLQFFQRDIFRNQFRFAHNQCVLTKLEIPNGGAGPPMGEENSLEIGRFNNVRSDVYVNQLNEIISENFHLDRLKCWWKYTEKCSSLQKD